MQELLGLKGFIDALSIGSNIHINICDFSGLLSHPLLELPTENRIHCRAFCDIAKSTAMGYETCINQKSIANKRAKANSEIFCGHCPFGLFEIGKPIVISGKTLGVIYVGNMVTDENFSFAAAKATCDKTGVNYELLIKEFKNCEKTENKEIFLNTAKAIEGYITLILKSVPKPTAEQTQHWLINELKRYVSENYKDPIKLKDIAGIYGFNEKYMGRLFKTETGISFSNYINELRLSSAKQKLISTTKSVTDIALLSGFDNVTYFNRLFKKQNGITPTEFRKKAGG